MRRFDQIAEEETHPLPARVVDAKLPLNGDRAALVAFAQSVEEPRGLLAGGTFPADFPATFGREGHRWGPCVDCGVTVEWADEPRCEACADKAEGYDYADETPGRGF